MSTVEITQVWLGHRPYVLVELDEDSADVTLGGNPTKEEADTLLRHVKAAVKPLKKQLREALAEAGK